MTFKCSNTTCPHCHQQPLEEKLTLSAFTVKTSQTPSKIQIWHESGEGGEFDKEKLTELIAKFYWENF